MTIAIVGVGETDYTFRDERPVAAMVLDAIHRALADAGLRPEDVDGFVSETYSTVAQRAGRRDLPAPRRAGPHVQRADVARRRPASSARRSWPGWRSRPGWRRPSSPTTGINLSADTGGPYAFHAHDASKVAFEMPFGYYGQPVYFAAIAERYRHEYGLSPRSSARCATSTRQHAMRTPERAQAGTADDRRLPRRRMISDPLRRLDCCLVNDGAIAYVMTSLDRARDLAKPPVVVSGVGLRRQERHPGPVLHPEPQIC